MKDRCDRDKARSMEAVFVKHGYDGYMPIAAWESGARADWMKKLASESRGSGWGLRALAWAARAKEAKRDPGKANVSPTAAPPPPTPAMTKREGGVKEMAAPAAVPDPATVTGAAAPLTLEATPAPLTGSGSAAPEVHVALDGKASMDDGGDSNEQVQEAAWQHVEAGRPVLEVAI